MKPLNALDALPPAFTRTHELMLQPFRVGRTWKLGACAYLALTGSIFAPIPLFLLAYSLPSGHPIVSALLVASAILFVILFFVGVRMQSVHFEMVVTRAKFIAPMWRRYGTSSRPWVFLKVALGTGLPLVFAPALISRGRQLFAQLHGLRAAFPVFNPVAPPDPVAVQGNIFALYARLLHILLPYYLLVTVLFLVLKLCSSLLEDFALPVYILDEVPLFESVRRGAQIIAADPLNVVLYYCVKVGVTVLGFIAQSVVSQIVIIPLSIVTLILGAIAGFIATACGASHLAAFGVGAAVGYGLLLLASIWSQMFTLGYALTVLEAYAIYFLGGRYQKLGDYLEPPSYTYAPPPMPPAPDEDDGGPPLPMDPALA